MKLKSLLLGSAAVLVAVSGARAADAIVVEPEPVEYVRVCDAYGKGWFYIPGTETCLKFGGEVRVQYESVRYHEEAPWFYTTTNAANNADTGVITGTRLARYDETSLHDADYRARLTVEARNETEYGTLASRIRFQGGGSAGTSATGTGGHNDRVSFAEGPGDGAVVVNVATISLAGFTTGYNDHFWLTNTGYGYYNARYDGIYTSAAGTGLFLQYQYAVNGLVLTVGAEDGNQSGEAGAPDLYAGFNYAASGLTLAGTYYHDSSAGAGAWKVRADYDFGNGFKFGGWYASDSGDTDYMKGHVWAVTAAYAFTDTMTLFGGYSSYSDQANDAGVRFAGFGVSPIDFDRSRDTWTVGLAWNIVPGLLIQPEYSATTFSQEAPIISTVTDRPLQLNNGQFSLRVVRSF